MRTHDVAGAEPSFAYEDVRRPLHSRVPLDVRQHRAEAVEELRVVVLNDGLGNHVPEDLHHRGHVRAQGTAAVDVDSIGEPGHGNADDIQHAGERDAHVRIGKLLHETTDTRLV